MTQITLDDLEIYPPAMAVLRAGAFVQLTSVEFSLLSELAVLAGRIADRDMLSTSVLGREYSPSDRSLDNHISHICKKLGPAADGRRRIVSIRGKGYMYRRFQPLQIDQPDRRPAPGKLLIAVNNGRKTEAHAPRTARRMSR
jgi:DNA-binding response OmpR family regulator